MADYLATPSGGSGPGVLVLHPWWGLNDVIRSFCDRLATVGFVALAPDLYGGVVTTERDEAERLATGLDGEKARRAVGTAVGRLTRLESVRRPEVGVVGFSLGASFALTLACASPHNVAAVALYYGTGDGELARARAAFLGHFAENDEFESTTYVNGLRDRLAVAGRSVTFHVYPGTRHWFVEEDRPEYDREAAGRAWERTVEFLRLHLG